MKPRISILGTGRMGSALISAFLKQGHSVDIWNRTKSKCEPLAAMGARIAVTVLDAVAATEIVVVNVNDYATSDHLLRSDEVTSALRGKLLVQLTSGTPKQAKAMAVWARQHKIHYLDGAIMAPPNFIGEPGCTILYSGPSDLFEEYKPVLLALGDNTLYLGSGVGHACALDNALLAVVWGAMFGALQGASICEVEQFPLETYMSSIHAIMPAVGASATDVAQRIQNGDFTGETSLGTVALHGGGVRRLIELCKEHGIHHAVPDAFDHLFQAAIKTGNGQDDFAVLHKLMR